MSRQAFEKRIPLATPTMHGDEIAYVEEALARNWVAPLGFNCDGFEKEMNCYLGEGRNCLSLCSATAALHLAVKLAGIKRGDKVICSDMTFAATVNPISYEGGVQVFVDSEADTWNMDPVALEAAFKKHPDAKAVMLAHLYGTPARMDEIMEICNRYGAALIEDAAEALSATYKGRQCGTFGHLGAISFNGNKIITSSGGGMLITEDDAERAHAFKLATQAREPAPWYQHEEIGYNYRMSNIVAGIGRAQLSHIEEHRERKTRIYEIYKRELADMPLSMNPYTDEMVPNFWLSCIRINDDCNVNPMSIMEKMNALNVETRPIWKPMHMQPVFRYCDFVSVADGPIDERLFAKGLCLPSDIKMTEEEQMGVIEALKECF